MKPHTTVNVRVRTLLKCFIQCCHPVGPAVWLNARKPLDGILSSRVSPEMLEWCSSVFCLMQGHQKCMEIRKFSNYQNTAPKYAQRRKFYGCKFVEPLLSQLPPQLVVGCKIWLRYAIRFLSCEAFIHLKHSITHGCRVHK